MYTIIFCTQTARYSHVCQIGLREYKHTHNTHILTIDVRNLHLYTNIFRTQTTWFLHWYITHTYTHLHTHTFTLHTLQNASTVEIRWQCLDIFVHTYARSLLFSIEYICRILARLSNRAQRIQTHTQYTYTDSWHVNSSYIHKYLPHANCRIPARIHTHTYTHSHKRTHTHIHYRIQAQQTYADSASTYLYTYTHALSLSIEHNYSNPHVYQIGRREYKHNTRMLTLSKYPLQAHDRTPAFYQIGLREYKRNLRILTVVFIFRH